MSLTNVGSFVSGIGSGMAVSPTGQETTNAGSTARKSYESRGRIARPAIFALS
jgi:hypothetical protein